MCPTDQSNFYMSKTLEGTIRQKIEGINFFKGK